MSKYNFKLQPLLNKEQVYEDECVRELKTIKEVLQGEQDRLEKLNLSKIKCQKELRSKNKYNITATELKVYEDYFEMLDYEIKNSNYLLKEINEKMQGVQDKLLKIMKKKKALEKLKERGMEEYLTNLYLSLNKELDDIAMIKFNKKQRDQ